MQPLIFPNSSYIVAVGATTEQEAQLKEAARGQRARVFICRETKDLGFAVSVMERILGFIIFDSKTPETQEQMKLINIRNSSCRSLKRNAEAIEISEAVDSLIHELVPAELEEVLKGAYEKIFPGFIDFLPALKAARKVPFGFDRQLNFTLVAGDLIGLGVLRSRLKGVEQMLAESKRPKALEVFQEAMNQCMGVIVQKLVKIGHEAKTGLPTLFDISTIPEIQFMAYFPSAHFVDEMGQMALSLGFVNVKGAKISLEGINKVGDESGDIEFL